MVLACHGDAESHQALSKHQRPAPDWRPRQRHARSYGTIQRYELLKFEIGQWGEGIGARSQRRVAQIAFFEDG